ncbi:MAG: DNA repair exonuclease [Oscillospiraceae bacterium]|jgi:DNA repair exonuclease SbcCD nuclease subunit|nr:DNA repair exonuclease [Oscillospiraceae bacterium]
MKFIHIADVHYGRWFAGDASRRRELADTFESIIDFANENAVDFILCAGDLIETESVSLADLYSLRDTIAKAECPFYAVAGNHDFHGEKSPYKKLEWPPNFQLAQPGWDKLVLPDLGIELFTFSWNKSTMREAKPFPFGVNRRKTSIMLLHGDMAKESSYFPLDLEELKKLNLDYIALGHIHKPYELAEGIVYAGSPEPLDSSETGEHGFYLCEKNKREFDYRFIPCSKRQYEHLSIELSPEESTVSLTKRILERTLKHAQSKVYQLILTGHPQAAPDLEAVLAKLEEKGISAKIVDETTPDFDPEMLLHENAENILGKFIASFGPLDSLNEESKAALTIGIEALLQTRRSEL